MQQLLIEEVTEFLGRAKHQRRGVDMQGYRNGYGKPRRLTMRSGTVTVRRPRLRDLDERLEYGYERVAELIDENGEQMVAFYRFPRGHWRHLRTSNVVESPFAALRLRTDAPRCACARATWSSRHSPRCACAPTRRSDSRRSPTRPLWYGRRVL